MKKAIAVYLRVPTSSQDVTSQMVDLRSWLKNHGRGMRSLWFRDSFTGTTLQRPAMRELEEAIRAGKIETLVVWRLDRLGRTAGQTVMLLDDLAGAGVRF